MAAMPRRWASGAASTRTLPLAARKTEQEDAERKKRDVDEDVV